MQPTPALFLATVLLAGPAGAVDQEQRVAESRAVVKEFATELKGALVGAMQNGGPVEAIAVCNTTAPAIAARASKKHGWRVGRTSLKYRNPVNAPDDWERSVLEEFDTRKTAGEDPKTLESFAVAEEDGRSQFRYMKAIPTAELCVTCHGSNIPPAVIEKLDALYPEDRARGYRPGDIRGAFTITQPM